MSDLNTRHDAPMRLAAGLDAGSVVAAHTRLLAALDDIEGSDAAAVLDLDLDDGAASTLSLQLLVSASRSFSADRFRLGPRAVAALATLDQPKEI